MTREEKLAEAKRLYQTANADQRYVLECLFPELKESEDERIRKELIEQIYYIPPKQNELKEDLDTLPCYEERIERYRAWLEKQGEQKQTWKPSAAQLIVIKDLIENENTSKVNKVILRGMFDELKQDFGL